MAESPLNDRRTRIVAMKKIIGQLEELLTQLNELGGEMPVIEKNVSAMKSFVAVLQYGISDLAEVIQPE
jgi:hypothetical protein